MQANLHVSCFPIRCECDTVAFVKVGCNDTNGPRGGIEAVDLVRHKGIGPEVVQKTITLERNAERVWLSNVYSGTMINNVHHICKE